MRISIVNFHCINFQIILKISSICYTFNNTIHNSYLLKLQLVDICIMMYHHKHNIDHKFILMSYLDITEDVLLYNVLLPINHYTGNITSKCHSKSMSDNRDLTGTFHQKISSLPVSISSDSRYFQSS